MARFPTTDMCDGALLEAFEPHTRSTDVFCATAAKSGQTWLLTLMHHLRTRGLDPDLGGKNIVVLTPWLELPRDLTKTGTPTYDHAERLAELDALPDPRVFKLHVTWEEIPRAAGSGARVVTVTRDLRELPYSMFSHLRGMAKPRPGFVDDFDAYFEKWMEFGYAFKFVRSFWPHRDDPDVCWLRYGDMQLDLRKEAQRLVDFLGWELDEAGMDRVLPLVDFGYMQSQEKSTLLNIERKVWRDDARFFREGAVGKNRARLSAEQEERIVERARRDFEPECFDFVMSLGD